jgi:OPA family glycerol-3-phosphate transporter-like MFS transporter 1/2
MMRGVQAPFNSEDGKLLLGKLDLAFLGAYALGMFGAGHLGDRIHLRKFLTAGMLGSGMMVCAFGLADFLDIHNFWYFIVVQAIGGGPPEQQRLKGNLLCVEAAQAVTLAMTWQAP